MRNEAQQALVNELKKTPEFNNIYFERDFNGINFQGFNILNGGAAQNAKILENTGNSQSSIKNVGFYKTASYKTGDGTQNPIYNNQKTVKFKFIYSGRVDWEVKGDLIIADLNKTSNPKVFIPDNNTSGTFNAKANDYIEIVFFDTSTAKINIYYNETEFFYDYAKADVYSPNKSFTINKEHAAFKVINKCTMMIAANQFTYVYYNNALTPLRAFNAKENDTFEIWNFNKDWGTIVLETENKNYTLKECIEQFHSIPKNSVNPGSQITVSLNYNLQANPLTLLENLVTKAKEINVNAALPLYIDNSIDLNECKSKFSTQALDLFLDMQGTSASKAFADETKVQYAIVSSTYDISEMFLANNNLLEVDILHIGPDCNAKKAFAFCKNLKRVTVHEVEGDNNTDLIFENDALLARTLGQDKMIEILKKLGAYDDWYNGINRSHFFRCPYNGTILPKFAPYEKQKENNFNPHWLIPEQLSQEDIREDAGYYNTNGEAKMWSDWSPTFENDDAFPVKIEIGASDGGSTQDTTTSYITIDNNKKYAIGRGHTIAWFKPSDTSNVNYAHIDTYDSANSGKLAEKLANIQSGYVVVITSSDATSVSSQDREALKLFGSVRNDTWEPRRFAHMFIGWRGAPTDQVYEYVGVGIESVKKDIFVSVPSDNKNFLFHKTVEYPRAIVPASRTECWPFVLKNIKSLWESCGFVKTKDKEFDVAFYIQWKCEDANFSNKFNENLKKSWITGDPFNIHLREMQAVGNTSAVATNLFSGIEWLKTIDINSENIENAEQAFSYCKNLKSVKGKINSKNNVGVNASSMFACSFLNVENPDLSNFECHFTYINLCFYKSGVTKIDWFDKWEGAKITLNIFDHCDRIIKIDTKVFPSTVEDIRAAFMWCKNLEEVQGGWIEPNSSLYYQNYTLSEVTLEQVKDFENPVYKEGFIIPPSVIDASYLFENCIKLKSVKDLKLAKEKNKECFKNCTSLKDVYNVNLNNGSAIDAFKNCLQNKDYRIWLPIIVESTTPYDKNNFLKTGLSIEHVKQFFVDDNFIFVDGKYEPFDAQRRINYENAINPERAFVFKYFTHPHADYRDLWGWNEIHDANVYYSGDVTPKAKV